MNHADTNPIDDLSYDDMQQLPNLADKIVVAVDGSPESAAALRWARDFVESSGGEIAVITAYAVTLAVTEAPFVHSDMYREADDAATEHVGSLIETTFGHGNVPHLVALGPIEQLVERHCLGSEMIVVGTRARRRWTDRWRGSTTNRITGAVDVPVISVPGGQAHAA
jgi:nucleotide-binding universal stress UspA family protein